MGFRFPLETLLRVREIAEQREERLLGQILAQIAQAHQTLTNLTEQRRAIINQRESSLQQQTSAFEITRSYEAIRTIDELEKSCITQLAKLEALKDQQMKAYEVAHRNQELLSGLREKQLAHYQQEQTRKEQSVMDDTFGSRRALR